MLRPKIRISSSIANFKDKLLKRTGLSEWHWNLFTPTIFVGMYHIGDYVRVILHMGPKKIFWTGSDILALTPLWASLLDGGKQYCENEVERARLYAYGIDAEICPMIFTEFKSEDAFMPVKNYTHVYLATHKDRLEEYGIDRLYFIADKCNNLVFHVYGAEFPPYIHQKNIIFHGQVTEEQFNREIRNYHAAIRLNKFDGFSETVAKSILLGQYPITRIKYPGIDSFETEEELVILLKKLRHKKEPNPERIVWWARLEANLNKLIGDWYI